MEEFFERSVVNLYSVPLFTYQAVVLVSITLVPFGRIMQLRMGSQVLPKEIEHAWIELNFICLCLHPACTMLTTRMFYVSLKEKKGLY